MPTAEKIGISVRGTETRTVAALAAGDLVAAFVPALGMIGCSLRHRGEELLGQRGGLEKYAASGSTMGIPLLHPWANRLAGFAYRAAGRDVVIDPTNPHLHRDGNGLPMHGLLAAYPGWTVQEQRADRLVAALDFAADADLLAAFPFPHTLTMAVTLAPTALTIATTLRATGAVAVPVSFGFHPYLTLPGVPRAQWRIAAPVRERALLDARGLPTGTREPCRLPPATLANRPFDDLYPALDEPADFVLAGGGRHLTVRFDAGYPCAQIFAPPGEAVICFEPMTAPTNALVSGEGLRLVEAGGEFSAAFSIEVGG